MFTGSVKLTIIEAANLRPTAYQESRIYLGALNSDPSLDPYVTIDYDEINFHR